MTSFFDSYNFTSLIKQPTCSKNPEKPSCIDLILTKRPIFFPQGTCVIETGLSEFHRVTVSVLTTYFGKLPPRTISYRKFSNYQNANFIKSMNDGLLEQQYMKFPLKDPNCFHKVSTEILNQHAPHKRYIYLWK